MNQSASISATITPTTDPTIQPIIVTVTTPPSSPTDYAAWAGFILALLLGAFELWKYWNDKGKLKITYRFEQEILGRRLDGTFTKMENGKTFWSIDIANIGSKSIIVTTLTLTSTDTKKYYQVTKDFSGDIPRFTLVPGDNHSYTLPNDLFNPRKLKGIIITDATGRNYKKDVKYSEK